MSTRPPTHAPEGSVKPPPPPAPPRKLMFHDLTDSEARLAWATIGVIIAPGDPVPWLGCPVEIH